MRTNNHFTSGLFCIVLFALVFFVPGSSKANTEIEIPSNFQQTQEDRTAWKRLNEIMRLLEDQYHRKIEGKELVDLILKGIVSIDPHTSIMPQRDLQQMRVQSSGKFGGVGMEITRSKEGERPGILIVSPIDDTPAARAGLQPQDIIISIEGKDGSKSTENMTTNEAVEMLRGKVGTDVSFTIVRENEEIFITVTREVIHIQFVKYELKENSVGYVRIASFSATVPEDVEKAIKKLVEENGGNPLFGLVLDLRNNPGGLLNSADAVDDLFLDRNTYFTDSDITYDDLDDLRLHSCGADIAQSSVTISTEQRKEIAPETCALVEGDILNGAPLLILINIGSASASEIVAGVLQIHGRAVVAGIEKSFGKGTIQTIIPLQTGGAFRVTSAQYLVGPVGCEIPIQGLGVTPDIMLESDKEKTSQDGKKEKDLENSLLTSTVSSEDCQYTREVSPEHLEAAYEMLEVMGLTPATSVTEENGE